MRVDLEYKTEWILYVDHPVWFLAWIVLTDRHSLLTAMGYYFFYKTLNIWILHAKMECTRFPVLEIRWFLVVS